MTLPDSFVAGFFRRRFLSSLSGTFFRFFAGPQSFWISKKSASIKTGLGIEFSQFSRGRYPSGPGNPLEFLDYKLCNRKLVRKDGSVALATTGPWCN